MPGRLKIACFVIGFMAADSRRVGPSLVKARMQPSVRRLRKLACFATAFGGASIARGLDERWPPGTLAAKKAMSRYQ